MSGKRLRVPYFDVRAVRNATNSTNASKASKGKASRTVVPKDAVLLGRGEFGKALRISPRQARDLVDRLDARVRGVWSLPRSTPNGGPSDHVVLKVIEVKADVLRTLTNALRELYIQWHLSTAPAKRVHGNVFDVKKYVPTPYFGGYVPSTKEFVICMKMQPGETLKNAGVIRNKDQYLDVERAYISMLLNNVLYVDFHEGNVMVTRDGDVRLIDFGGAVLLSDAFPTKSDAKNFRRRLRRFLASWPHRTTYVAQRKHLNERLLFDFDSLDRVEKTLGIVAKTATSTLADVRGMIRESRRDNVRNLLARNAPVQYRA